MEWTSCTHSIPFQLVTHFFFYFKKEQNREIIELQNPVADAKSYANQIVLDAGRSSMMS
jgi:hypothetical protein